MGCNEARIPQMPVKQGVCFVTGGRERPPDANVETWRKLDTGIILRIDEGDAAPQRVVEYATPPEARVANLPSITFKASSRVGDLVYACTETEVIVYRLPSFTVERYISLPLFNDVHHVVPTERGTLLVAVTGLDMVVEIDATDRVVREWDAGGQGLWTRFSRDVDYRREVTPKPRLAHPNFVFEVGNDIWVTRNEMRDALCLTSPERRIAIWEEGIRDVSWPHDGLLIDDLVYFTTVDGHVVIADPISTKVVKSVDLMKLMGKKRRLGWCRGLKPAGPDKFLIGFTRLRPTRFVQNLGWVKSRLKDVIGVVDGDDSGVYTPTQIIRVDVETGETDWSLDLEEHGMNAVFSIL
jgi:hypothetical protein